MELEAVNYEVDGESFAGFLADGSGGRRAPGVLVAHDGGGLTDHTKQRARMLAELGFVAFAMDTYGESNPSLERMKAIVQELREDRAVLRRRAGAALAVLTGHPNVDPARIGAIGFCFGGTAVLELARGGADLACVVGFHAGLDRDEAGDASAIKGRVLVCQGDKDPVITAQHRDDFAREMAESCVDWQMILYSGVGHSFTNPEIDAWELPGFAYDEVADRRSWIAMRNLFDEVLGPVQDSHAPSATSPK